MYAWSSLKAGSLDKRTTAVACENSKTQLSILERTCFIHVYLNARLKSLCQNKTGLKNSCGFPPALSFVIGSTSSCDVFWPITMNTLFLSTDQKENKKQLDLVYTLFPADVCVIMMTATLWEAWWPHSKCTWLWSELSGFEPCVVFLGKTLFSHSTSLHPGV